MQFGIYSITFFRDSSILDFPFCSFSFSILFVRSFVCSINSMYLHCSVRFKLVINVAIAFIVSVVLLSLLVMLYVFGAALLIKLKLLGQGTLSLMECTTTIHLTRLTLSRLTLCY